jgi:hypothetical protein
VVYLSPFPLSIGFRRPPTHLPLAPPPESFFICLILDALETVFAEPGRFENRILSSPEGFETHFLSGFVFFWIFIDFGDPQTSGIIDFACPAQCFLQFQQNRR